MRSEKHKVQSWLRIRIHAVMFLSLVVVAQSWALTAEPAVVATEFIYDTAPFKSCHASMIVDTDSGLVAAWFGGEYEKHPSVGIWMSRKVKSVWTAPIEVANGNQPDGSRLPCWNPVLFQPRAVVGESVTQEMPPLWLFFKVGPSPSRWWGEYKTSRDGGATWSHATRLPDGILGPIKNKPVQLRNGDWLCASSSEDNPAPNDWQLHFELSQDSGKSWSKIKPAAATTGKGVNAIQPSVLFHANGRLQAVGRSKHAQVFETWSSDNGRSWSPLELTSLPNPNSGTDAVTLKDGRQLIVYNHTPKGRSPLNVALSKDGKEWLAALTLEREPGEYSYPAVIQSADKLIHITYTWKRQRIRHVVIDPAKLVLAENVAK